MMAAASARSSTRRRAMRPSHGILAVLAALIVVLGGCLNSEFYEIRCSRNQDNATWTTTHSFWNLGSDAEDIEDQSEDFDSLIALWKSAEFAADTSNGQLMERSLWVEGNQVNGRMVYLSREIPYELRRGSDSMAIETDVPDPNQVVETNGTVVPGKTVVVRWPSGSKEMRIKLKDDSPLHHFSKEQRERISLENKERK